LSEDYMIIYCTKITDIGPVLVELFGDKSAVRFWNTYQ